MEKVTISPKFQLVIPRSVRERLNLRPGQRIKVIPTKIASSSFRFVPLGSFVDPCGDVHRAST